MIHFIVLLALSGCAFAGPEQCLQRSKCRIIGGHSTDIKNHPYQVSIQRSTGHFCGGSLFKSNVVITAAHCLEKERANEISVRLGSTEHNSGGVIRKVSSFKIHPNYNSSSINNDVAVIKLVSAVEMGHPEK